MRFLLFVLPVLLVLGPTASARAQSLEVFAVTGGVQVWDDEGNIGSGVPIGGGVGLRWPRGWGIEALVERQQATRNFASGVSFDSTITAARARLLKYFGRGPAHPYAGGGVGVSRIETARTEPPGFGGVFTGTATAGALSGFAGVRIPAGRRMFVRPEFEVSHAGEHLRIGGTVAVGASW